MRRFLFAACASFLMSLSVTSYADDVSLEKASVHTDKKVFTSDNLPHNLIYPVFLNEELYFVPDETGTHEITKLTDLNNVPLILFTPMIHTLRSSIKGDESLYTNILGRNSVFLENKLDISVNIYKQNSLINYRFNIESSKPRFTFEKHVPKTLHDAITNINEDSYTDMISDSLKGFLSQKTYHMTSRKHLDTGFDIIQMKPQKVTYKGHYEVVSITPYLKNIQGRYVLRLTFENPSKQNVPQ